MTALSDSLRNKFSCLILEDDPAFAEMAATVVRAEGGEPLVVGTLAAARDAVEAHIFAMVLLDNHLPDGKGYDFFQQLTRRYPDAPVIMITGVPDLSQAVALTRNGLFEYLTNPLELEPLASCLQRAKLRLQAQALAEPNVESLGESAAM